jgi:glycosyltransferase involved in cell wall biosynthesis
MKIALLHDSVLPPKNYGGIERIVVSLAQEYQRRGHEVVVLCRSESKLEGFEVVPLPSSYQSASPATWLPSGIDFLHAHQPLLLKPDIPFLVTIHGNGHVGERYWRNTNFLSQSHARNHNAKYVIYNGVDPERYPFTAEKEDYFVFLARASWRVKNLRTCIDLARDLGVKLIVMGGTGRNSKYVEYKGMIGEAQGKLEILRRARALLYPTNWDEPCAVAPLEALACGTPVLSSVNGCMPELVRPGTGFAVECYSDLLQVTHKLNQIDPRECRKSVETFFSTERMALDYLALIERILKHGELDQEPHYAFQPSSVKLLYKPSFRNHLRVTLTGKI